MNGLTPSIYIGSQADFTLYIILTDHTTYISLSTALQNDHHPSLHLHTSPRLTLQNEWVGVFHSQIQGVNSKPATAFLTALQK